MIPYVFQYWDNATTMPVRYVVNRAMCMKMNPELVFVLLTLGNVSKFLPAVHPAFEYLAPNFQSDVIRGSLLDEYGGMWLDLDVMCVNRLWPKFEQLSVYGGEFEVVNYVWPPEGRLAMGTSMMGPMMRKNFWSVKYTERIANILSRDYDAIVAHYWTSERRPLPYGSRIKSWRMHIELSWQILEAMWEALDEEPSRYFRFFSFDGRDSWIYGPMYAAQPHIYVAAIHGPIISTFLSKGSELMPTNSDFRIFKLLGADSNPTDCKYVLCALYRAIQG